MSFLSNLRFHPTALGARFSQNLSYKTLRIIGGENINEQIEKLKNDKPNIVVGTPGRVLGLIKKNVLDCSSVKVFIIDECDKMLQQLGKQFSWFFLLYSTCRSTFQTVSTSIYYSKLIKK